MTLKTNRKLIYIFSIILLVSISASACKNPILGLGPAADIASPTGEINEYSNGDYVNGTIVLSGTSDDDVGIESVRGILDTKVLEAELTAGESTLWSIPINTSDYPDGEYTVILTITDSAGRETEKRILLYFDNTAPTVMVTSSEGITAGASTNSPVIRGEAYDYLFSRIDHMEASVISGDAEIVGFQGTNGWSLTLQTTGTGNYAVRIKAFDSAGNANTWQYHSQDFPLNTKIEDVAEAELTGKLGTLDLEPVRKTSQEVEVDLSLDEPQIVVSNPEEGKTAAQNILGGTSVAVGYIEDDDEVDVDTIELSTDGGSAWTSLSGERLSGSGGFIRWNYPLSALENGVHYLQIRAADTNKPTGDIPITAYSPVIPFTIDKSAPSVTVDSPEPGAYLSSGNFTLSGDAEDSGGTIETVRVSVNGGAYFDASFTPAETVAWTYDISGAAAGAVDIEVEAVDNSGKTTRNNMQVYVDIAPPTIEFLSPSAGLFINGTTSVQGISSDNWSLKQVKLQIGGLAWAPEAAETLPPAEFYSWQRTIVSSDFENTGMAVEVNGSGDPQSGTGIWELKIWAEAVDKADNTTLEQHMIYIDNSLDRPGINIASPSDGAVLAGSVILSGSAWDDTNEAGEALDHIELRIWKGTDGGGGSTVFTELFDLSVLPGLPDVYGDGSWYSVSGTSTWQTELNADGEFYPDGINHNGTVKIDVRAVDQKGGLPDLAGNFESIEVTFDDTVPYFSSLSHSSGEYENGTFSLTGTVSDDDSVKRLRISYNGGVDWTTIGNDLGASSPFSHSINTVDKIGDSGILYLRLEALDTANYKTLAAINLNVDNLNPTGSYTAAVTDLQGDALVQGTASDTGAVSGIDRIEVSFTLDGVPVNAENSKGDREAIVINSRTEVGNDSPPNGDDDGFDESMSLSGSEWTWWAEFDTDSLDDGVLEVLYTVYDYAGNEYSETVTGGNIKNHAPVITSISAGWDYDHDGTVEAGESKSYASDTTESNTVYGDLNYTFNRTYDGQNGILSYAIRIKPSATGIWTDVASVSQSGTLDTSSLTEFTEGDGDYEIEFSVTDTKAYSSLRTIGFTIENNDNVRPTMDFNALTETDASNVKTAGTGHIEVDTKTYLSGTIPFTGRAEDNQRIESIAVSINGAAADVFVQWDGTDNRLEYISDGSPLEAGSGFIDDGGTLLHRAEWKYDWDSSTLPSGLNTTVRFIVNDAGLSNDPAIHSPENIRTFDVVPYISRIETSLSGSFSDTLARSAQGKYPVLIESSESTFETLTLHGWNLDSSAAGAIEVRLSNDTDALEADGTTPTGTDLTPVNTVADDGEITVVLNAAGSGYLTVLVDGVASRNNTNSNAQTYNLESSDVHQSLTDDRYISLWDITRLWRTITKTNHAAYPSMVLSADVPHFTYVNNSEGWGQGFYLAGTDNNYVVTNWDLFTYTSLDLNDDGAHGALVDVNVVNGNFGDNNSGNYGGIFTNFFYDSTAPPYTDLSNSDFTYDFLDNGIWLENLVDTTDPKTTAVLNRYQYPDMILEGPTTSTDVFYSVYDNLEQRLIFRHFRVGTTPSIGSLPGGRVNNTGTALYTDVIQQENDGTFPEYNGDNRYANSSLTGSTPSGAQYLSTSASKYSAVGATQDGSTAVIAYYDTSASGKLVFRYNETPDSEASWSTGITIDEFVDAEYIDMKVDTAGHIHLAYYDSLNGDVKYAYIPAYNSLATAVDVYTVDSYLIVGSKLTLDVTGSGDVYLAYKSLGNSARAAWLTGAAGDGVSGDEFTETWEVQTIPNLISDSDSNRFNVGVDSAGLPVVGYTDDGLEYVRLLPELSN